MVRHEKDGRSVWLLPGGGVEYGESLEQALKREMLEETGLAINLGELVLMSDSISPDGNRHVLNIVFLTEAVSEDAETGEDERVMEVRFIDSVELAGMVIHPDIGEELAKGIRDGFGLIGTYLGGRWID